MNKTLGAILLVSTLLSGTGCTTHAWYDAVQGSAKYQCKHQPQTERERCMERTSSLSYEEYQKVRAGEGGKLATE